MTRLKGKSLTRTRRIRRLYPREGTSLCSDANEKQDSNFGPSVDVYSSAIKENPSTPLCDHIELEFLLKKLLPSSPLGVSRNALKDIAWRLSNKSIPKSNLHHISPENLRLACWWDWFKPSPDRSATVRVTFQLPTGSRLELLKIFLSKESYNSMRTLAGNALQSTIELKFIRTPQTLLRQQIIARPEIKISRRGIETFTTHSSYLAWCMVNMHCQSTRR